MKFAAILDALETSCANCSNEQRKLAEQVIQYLYFNKRDKFDELAMIYDLEGVFQEHYIAEYLVSGSWMPDFRKLTPV
ncbi:hypothetical protein LSTR_LSTR003775 [Laodelphax striatellus]|uniref:Uncharacterized protein n=1 Tax=Laodelphax striatellus TaxID=195883 RepID=A0A482WP06_LAOST|nr:hypothetical protein LSTR_LSTR003775 [Laodelphax striatellus]